MRRFAMFGIALVASVVLGASSALAQEQEPIVREIIPVPVDQAFCNQGLEVFDLDGNGYVGKSDMVYWFNQAVIRGCEFGAPANGQCAQLDLNGDGQLDFDDANFFAQHYAQCFRRTNSDVPPQRNNPRDPNP